MRPADRLRQKLDQHLKPKGVETAGSIDFPTGGQRQLDTCRWCVWLKMIDGGPIGSMASWDTISDCLRFGFHIQGPLLRAEADYMVSAGLSPDVGGVS